MLITIHIHVKHSKRRPRLKKNRQHTQKMMIDSSLMKVCQWLAVRMRDVGLSTPSAASVSNVHTHQMIILPRFITSFDASLFYFCLLLCVCLCRCRCVWWCRCQCGFRGDRRRSGGTHFNQREEEEHNRKREGGGEELCALYSLTHAPHHASDGTCFD